LIINAVNRLHTTDEQFINRMNEIILENLKNEKFGVKEFARLSGMSPSTLNSRFRSILNKNINQFIREVRLKKALDILQNENVTASEVSYLVGFKSPAYFTHCFHDHFGYPPGKIERNSLFPPVEANNNSAKPQSVQNMKGSKVFILKKYLILMVVSIITIIIILTYFTFTGHNSEGKTMTSNARTSVAVMPFTNLSIDTTLNIWQYGIQNNLITSLSNSEELAVRQGQYVNGLLQSKGITNFASLDPSVVRAISKKLDADIFIYGSISQSGSLIRINAQLTDPITKTPSKSFQIDGSPDRILNIIDSLAFVINKNLLINKLGRLLPPASNQQFFSTTDSPEAYRNYINGLTEYNKNNFPSAISLFLQALAIDSTLVGAMAKISSAYYNQGQYEEGKIWCLRYHRNQISMTLQQKIWADVLYAEYFETPSDRITHLNELIELDEHQPIVYFQLGDSYLEIEQYEKAIPEFEKALEIFDKMETKPFLGAFYYELGKAYHNSGQYSNEKKLYKRAVRDFPDDPELLAQIAWLLLTEGDTAKANIYIDRWITIRMEQSWPEASISSYLSYIYIMAGLPDKAEKYLREALLLDPENPDRMNNLAYFLIEKDRNQEESMALIERALKLKPDNYVYLHTKGWGLYKKALYSEALNLLQRSWDYRRQRSIYNYTASTHLEKAKKAAVRLKYVSDSKNDN
jgi:tetratricopeptide (TPR) repeat protein/AraC-like DNA-binding protein